MSNVSLMECENCGARAINGEVGGWTSRGDERFHAWSAYVEACRALKLPEPKDGESWS